MKNASNNKISIRKIDSLIRSMNSDRYSVFTYDVENEKVEILVKKFLTPEEEFACANQIASQVFIDETYVPEVFDASVLMNFILFYTNIKVEIGITRAYELAYGCDLVNELMGVINTNQWNNILRVARESIDYKNKARISQQESKLMELVQKIDDATSVLSMMNDTLKDIDSTTIQEAIANIARIDNESIIQSVAKKDS